MEHLGHSDNFKVGDKVKISEGSGLDSGKTATIVDRSKIKTDGRGIPINIYGAYKPVDWKKEIAIQLEDGTYRTMFKSRLIKQSEKGSRHLGHSDKLKKGDYVEYIVPKKLKDKVSGGGRGTLVSDPYIKDSYELVDILHDGAKEPATAQMKDLKKIAKLKTEPSLTDPKAYDLFLNLKQFTGTMNYYQHPLSGYKYTDGVQYLAEKGEAYWLIDKILITTKHIPKLQLQEYQEFTSWKLIVNDDRTATLTAEDGNGHKIYSEKINYTDFPLKEISLWFEGGVLLLPSEH